MPESIHPSVDGGVKPGREGFAGGKLRCHCKTDPVEVTLGANTAFNHACGCTKCWKPEGATFAVVAVVPRDAVTVTANGQKLKIVDPSMTIQRYACTGCGVPASMIDETKAAKPGAAQPSSSESSVWTKSSPLKAWSVSMRPYMCTPQPVQA